MTKKPKMPTQNAYINKNALVYSVIILFILTLTIIIILYFSVPPTELLSLNWADKIADAISTPPKPVPQWLSFLHPWQTLFSALLALIAALIGAHAIMEQAETSLRAVQKQIDQARQNQIDKDKREIESISGAIAAELKAFISTFENIYFRHSIEHAIYKINKMKIATVIPIFPIFLARPRVYEAVCGNLGIFPDDSASKIAETYSILIRILDMLQAFRNGDYNRFLETEKNNTQILDSEIQTNAEHMRRVFRKLLKDHDKFSKLVNELTEELCKK